MNDHHASRSGPAAPARGRAADFRPTLFGEDEEPAGAAGADGLRILGSLQAAPAPRRGRGGRWVLGALAIAALGAAVWVGMRQAGRSVDTDLVTRQPSSAGHAAPASASAAAPAASAGAAGPQAGALSGAARIELDLPAVQASAADPFAGLAPAGAPPMRVAGAEPQRRAARALLAPGADAASRPARRAADEDVALIEAVVAHGAGRQRAAQPTPAPPWQCA